MTPEFEKGIEYYELFDFELINSYDIEIIDSELIFEDEIPF